MKLQLCQYNNLIHYIDTCDDCPTPTWPQFQL